MTEIQFERASRIQAEIEGINNELASWAYAGKSDVCNPLTLRMAGVLKHTPAEAFVDFKLFCIIGMQKRLEELRMEFERL